MLNHKALSASATVKETDANFKQTVLLLHGDGTNGAQNNTFLDSSTNNFTITRNGNTTQGTFSPFSVGASEWSNYFDGSGDNVYTPSTTALNVGSGNFTIECFFNVSSFNGGNILRAGNQYGGFALLLSGTAVVYYLSTNGSNWNLASAVNAGTGLSTGTWYHLALVRNGNTITPYVNGVAGTSTTTTSALADLNGFNVGAEQNATASGSFNGYISNVRVVVGTAVYTSAFTPPSAPLTAISGTQLLTCQSNRFKDNSSNAFALTVAGNTSVQPFSPFAPSAAYSASTNGGSGYFDGSGDYLSLADNSAFEMGSGDFTIEGWIYPTSTSNGYVVSKYAAGSNFSYVLGYGTSWDVAVYGSGGTNAAVYSGSAPSINQWIHFALTRNGSNNEFYVNGSRVASVTAVPMKDSTDVLQIGNLGPGYSVFFTGYMSDIRLVKGTAVYTGTTYTIPTSPLSAITNTSLLCKFQNAAILDNTGKNNLETVGNAQIDTGTKKFGTGSLEFDGTGDYLVVPASPNFVCGGDFTIEMWLYPNASGTFRWFIGNYTTNAATNWLARIGSANTIEWFIDSAGTSIATSVTISAGQWYHIALVRSGSTYQIYVDGVSRASGTFSGVFGSATKVLRIGDGNGDVFNGFIDEVRMTNGIARYTANFTPPAKAFADQ